MTSFLLEQKELKIQERLIALPRTRSAPRSWVATFLVITLQCGIILKLKTLILYAFRTAGKIYALERRAGWTPGGDLSVLYFWFFFIKQKERKGGEDPIKNIQVTSHLLPFTTEQFL